MKGAKVTEGLSGSTEGGKESGLEHFKFAQLSRWRLCDRKTQREQDEEEMRHPGVQCCGHWRSSYDI